jgi:hypothetical protein
MVSISTVPGLTRIFSQGNSTGFWLKINFSQTKSLNCANWCNGEVSKSAKIWLSKSIVYVTDYGHPVRKSPSLHGRKSNPNPKFLGTAEAYFVCHIGPSFQISLIYAFTGCPQSVPVTIYILNPTCRLSHPQKAWSRFSYCNKLGQYFTIKEKRIWALQWKQL